MNWRRIGCGWLYCWQSSMHACTWNKNTSTGVLVMGRKYHCTCLLVTRWKIWSEVSKVRLTRIVEEQSREASEKQYRRACAQCVFSLPAKIFQHLTICVWYLFQGVQSSLQILTYTLYHFSSPQRISSTTQRQEQNIFIKTRKSCRLLTWSSPN